MVMSFCSKLFFFSLSPSEPLGFEEVLDASAVLGAAEVLGPAEPLGAAIVDPFRATNSAIFPRPG